MVCSTEKMTGVSGEASRFSLDLHGCPESQESKHRLKVSTEEVECWDLFSDKVLLVLSSRHHD